MEKKNICFIAPGVLPIPTVKGGAVETLVEYLVVENEQKKLFDFTVYTAADKAAISKEKEFENTRFIHFTVYPAWLNKLYSYAYRLLKQIFRIYIPYCLEYYKLLRLLKHDENKYDYVVYEAGETSQIPLLNKYIKKEKLLVHLHWQGYWNRADMKRIDKSFATLIPVSEFIGNGWKAACNDNKRNVRVLKNCANIERFMNACSKEENVELKRKLNIPQNDYVIIFTGRIVKEKGIKELLKAFELVKTKNVTLLVIGSANFGSKTNTPYEQEISKLIKESSKNIVFTGFVHQTQLYRYYSIADVAVMPSMFEDPAPLVSIETQATGTPLIATNVGGIKEYTNSSGVILINKTKHMVDDIAKSIDYVLNDEKMRILMGEANRQNAQKYTTEKYYADFAEIIKEQGKYGR